MTGWRLSLVFVLSKWQVLGTVCLRVMPPPAHVQPALALAQAQRGPPGTLVPWPVGAMPWVQPCALEGWACGARAVGCRARAVGSRGSPQSLSPALRPRDHAGGGAPCVSSSSSGSGRRSAAAARALRSRQASEPRVNDGDGTEAAARGDVRGVRRETAPEGRGWVTVHGPCDLRRCGRGRGQRRSVRGPNGSDRPRDDVAGTGTAGRRLWEVYGLWCGGPQLPGLRGSRTFRPEPLASVRRSCMARPGGGRLRVTDHQGRSTEMRGVRPHG